MSKGNSQLDWLKSAPPAEKPFIAMAVGWQTVVQTINEGVIRFNNKYFSEDADPHHEMRIIAAKMMVVATLKELRLSVGRFRDRVATSGRLSESSRQHWKSVVVPLLADIDKFRDVRNCAFHLGDPLEDPDELVSMYEEIRDYDLGKLNEILKALTFFGEMLKADALTPPTQQT